MSESETLASLQKQRTKTKSNIIRIRKLYLDGTGSTDPVDMQLRLEMLDTYIKQLMEFQNEIERLNPDDNKRGELEDVCIGAKSILLTKINSSRRVSTVNDCTLSVPTPPANRLPHLKIPKFSGKYSEYKNFITCFNNLVHDDPTLSVIEKFNHLINSLQDDALRTVKAFQVNEQNYSSALKRLAERYDNDCLIFQDHVATLFNLKKIGKPCATGLRHIVDTVSAVLDSLSHIGKDDDITNAIVIHLVLSKLDPDSKAKWDENLDYTKLPKWKDCASVLIRRCQFLEINNDEKIKSEQSCNKQNKSRVNDNNYYRDRKGFKSSFACVEAKLEECLFCAGRDHMVNSCPMFSSLKVNQRFKFIKEKGLCINCLKVGHSVRKCRSHRCSICQRPHHILLHNEDLVNNDNTPSINYSAVKYPISSNAVASGNSAQCLQASSKINRSPGQCVNTTSNYAGINSKVSTQVSGLQSNRDGIQDVITMYLHKEDQQVILATAVVQIKDRNGKYQPARALLDSGSQVNLITEEMAQCLSLKRFNTCLNIAGIGHDSRKVKHGISSYIKSCINEFEFLVECYIIKSISGKQPNDRVERRNLGIPSNLVLADPNFDRPQKIDVLIGAESFFDLLSIGQIKLGPSLPTLQKTLLGWIVSGKCDNNMNTGLRLCQLVTNKIDCKLDLLNSLVEKFWEIEQVPMCSKMTEEHVLCENHFRKYTQRTDDGRFEVRLPFKEEPTCLGLSYEVAKRRFLSLERRLSRDRITRGMYIDFMKEYLNLGHMSPVCSISPNSSHYVIPHQCVIKAHSTTTKLRVVFDASSKTSTQKSLNDALLVGPTIQEDLFSILLRFRLNKFALTADITKMYRQVRVHKDDRRFQLILWRENPDLPIQSYELNTVTYGTAPAPFLAIRCLKELSEIYKNVYPLGANIVARDFYVDDLLTGANNLDALAQIRKEVTEILGSCGFHLAKFYSNCRGNDNVELVRHMKFNGSDSTRALGIIWKPGEDNLFFELENNFMNVPATKRNILSISSRLFDPLGLIAPIIIRAKILLQEIWECNLDWDESIPQSLDTTWRSLKEVLSQIHLIAIPRFVGTTLTGRIQLHGFADASMRAYGCCIYIRYENAKGIDARLLLAKSKVAPSKKVKTLPRLELSAAHLLSKLWNAIRSKFEEFKVVNVIFWSDSEIVLHWIKTHPSILQTFVGNRVAEIQEYTSSVKWQYVPTTCNPADIVSRGCNVEEIERSIWFSGPEFLRRDASDWPKNEHFHLSPECLALEKKKSKISLLNIKSVPQATENRVWKLVESISSYKKIIRIVAYVLRFIKGMRDRTYGTNGFNVTLLRVGGRLGKSALPYESKYPLLLTRNSHFIKVYFFDLHKTNCHVGPRALVGLSRERLWVIQARQLARKTVNSCIPCFYFKPKLANQIMGDLPRDRTSYFRPFWVCGVDLCGPVYTSLKLRGKPLLKTYVAVFVCFASKAVHLEALSDLQTDTFLFTLTRFIGRRGVPKTIWCDNATNFIGTARIWNEKSQLKIQQTAAERGIEFRFIPPRAPHFGGLWEAAVKSAKSLLLRTVAKANLSYEELTSVLVDVEAVLNSRPIVALTEDPNDGEALTPGHMLIGCSLKALPEIKSQDNKVGSLKRFRLLSSLKEHFWAVWQRDYVRELQQRIKWTSPNANIKIGDVVIVHEDNVPPLRWLIGKIVQVETSRDGNVRVAEVKTKNGTYRRPIHKLAPLPIDDSQSEYINQPCKVAGVTAELPA